MVSLGLGKEFLQSCEIFFLLEFKVILSNPRRSNKGIHPPSKIFFLLSLKRLKDCYKSKRVYTLVERPC
jgi:hypothetical protein